MSNRRQWLMQSSLAALALVGARIARAEMPDLSLIHGKIKVVDSFPDYKVKIVESFADLHVQVVESFPDKPGQ